MYSSVNIESPFHYKILDFCLLFLVISSEIILDGVNLPLIDSSSFIMMVCYFAISNINLFLERTDIFSQCRLMYAQTLLQGLLEILIGIGTY